MAQVQTVGPLLLHDGSEEALQAVQVTLALSAPNVEVINMTTEQGKKRISEIDNGLADGTMVDTSFVPPLCFCLEDSEI